MKILVATRLTQGARANDFCWTEEDELVRYNLGQEPGNLWVHRHERPDGKCGCRRCMTGMKTLRSTTTIRVTDLPLTREQYLTAIMDSYRRAGFDLTEEALRDFAEHVAFHLLEIAEYFRRDTVLEYRGWTFRDRLDPSFARLIWDSYGKIERQVLIDIASQRQIVDLDYESHQG